MYKIFGCECGQMYGRPHCHTAGDCPPETPSTHGRKYCSYGCLGCNVDHDEIAIESTDIASKVNYLLTRFT